MNRTPDYGKILDRTTESNMIIWRMPTTGLRTIVYFVSSGALVWRAKCTCWAVFVAHASLCRKVDDFSYLAVKNMGSARANDDNLK